MTRRLRTVTCDNGRCTDGPYCSSGACQALHENPLFEGITGAQTNVLFRESSSGQRRSGSIIFDSRDDEELSSRLGEEVVYPQDPAAVAGPFPNWTLPRIVEAYQPPVGCCLRPPCPAAGAQACCASACCTRDCTPVNGSWGGDASRAAVRAVTNHVGFAPGGTALDGAYPTNDPLSFSAGELGMTGGEARTGLSAALACALRVAGLSLTPILLPSISPRQISFRGCGATGGSVLTFTPPPGSPPQLYRLRLRCRGRSDAPNANGNYFYQSHCAGSLLYYVVRVGCVHCRSAFFCAVN